MTYRGHVEGGVIVLDKRARLPEGTKVKIEPLARQRKTLAKQSQGVIGKASGLPEDLAEEHDHYLYGAPKRKKRTLLDSPGFGLWKDHPVNSIRRQSRLRAEWDR